MTNPQLYGHAPYCTVLIHGGPGAPGSLAPVAKELSRNLGVIEPLQSKASIEELILELNSLLNPYAKFPVTMVGHSWGAWLSYLYAARYPVKVKKLILICSGPFEEKYVAGIMRTRIERLSYTDKLKLMELENSLLNVSKRKKDSIMAEYGEFVTIIDSYDPLPSEGRIKTFRFDNYLTTWSEVSALRKSGKLLSIAKNIRCPVVAIHGDYDPRPAAGIEEPLSGKIKNFRMVIIKKCGHEPWSERKAKDKFYDLLRNEID